MKMGTFKTIREKHANELVLFLIFIVIFIAMSILAPGQFLSAANLQNMACQMPEFGLMALAMMVAILTGGINLSVTNGAMLAAIVAAIMMTGSFSEGNSLVATIIGIVAIIVFSMVTGLINGWLVGYIGIVAMLATLGTKMVFEGLGLVITKGNSIGGLPAEFLALGRASIGPIPLALIVFIVVSILSYYAMERSKFGQHIYMVGVNSVATRFSGINVKRVLLLVYVMSGFLYGLAGVLICSRYCSAKTDYGSSYLMQALTAVVMGGTDINGGSGKVVGTVLAVLILQTVSTGFTIFRVDQNLVNIFTGIILIVVLFIRFLTTYIVEQKKIKARQAGAVAK